RIIESCGTCEKPGRVHVVGITTAQAAQGMLSTQGISTVVLLVAVLSIVAFEDAYTSHFGDVALDDAPKHRLSERMRRHRHCPQILQLSDNATAIVHALREIKAF